jgi:putative ABC transport system permease protein
MSSTPAGTTLRVLLMAQLRQQPARLIIMIVVIALGVALGTSVYLVNATALNEFTGATKRLVGEADVIVRGSPAGFAESLYPRLAHDPQVRLASPVLEVMAAVPGKHAPLKVIALDIFRAGTLQPALLGELTGDPRRLFAPRGIYLSQRASVDLGIKTGQPLTVIVGSEPVQLEVLGLLSAGSYPQSIGLMDIAAAQWTFHRLGLLNRIDLQLQPGVNAQEYMRSLGARLPSGAVAVAPEVERDRAATVTRAYRVNLNMLALVALFTSAFLVFSIQSLAMLRRRAAIALLRALGVTRAQMLRALIIEGIAIGAAASALGVVVGVLLAAAVVQWLNGDFGNGQIHVDSPLPQLQPAALLIAFLAGTAFGALGAAVPAAEAARRDPARGLKSGDAQLHLRPRSGLLPGAMLLLAALVLLALPASEGLPLAGYAAVALLLFGGIAWVPLFTAGVLRALPVSGQAPFALALRQLQGNRATVFLSLAPIIVSFALMVSMAIMVHSFRQSFEAWLDKLLPADVQMRLPSGSDTASWSRAEQQAIGRLEGVTHADFRRTRPLYLDPALEPVTLIARDLQSKPVADILPLVSSATRYTVGGSVWISEAAADKFRLRVGSTLRVPLGTGVSFVVAGIWRDYARTEGALVIDRDRYVALTSDADANDASLWLTAGTDLNELSATLRNRHGAGGVLEIMTSGEVKRRSLRIFDRAFAITYGLETLAVLIGLVGISVAASFSAIARRSEFGMLRHVGMLRRQIVQMLAAEGVATALLGALYGLVLGFVLSLVLVFVINRQSFNWSIDLSVPVVQLSVFAAALVLAAAVTAVISGRAALSADALRAVREDW